MPFPSPQMIAQESLNHAAIGEVDWGMDQDI